MVSVIPTKLSADMSSSLKDIAIYDKIQNGGHVVHPIMAKSISTDSAWCKESIDTTFMIFWQTVQKLFTKIAIFHISWPIGGAIPNFALEPQHMLPMKCTNFRFDWSNFGRDTAS